MGERVIGARPLQPVGEPATVGQPIDVLVVGSINVDVFANVDELPGPGETVIARSAIPDALGGKGANQAAAAAAMGASTVLVGAVGADRQGQWLMDALAARAVDASMLMRSDQPSGWAHVVVDTAGENMIIVDPGANTELTVEHVCAAFARFQPAVVLAQLEIPVPAVLAALRAGKACGALTLCNASPVNGDFRLVPELLDCLIVNHSEAQRMSGATDPETAARRLAALTSATVLTTMGSRGVLVATGAGAVCALPAVTPAKVVDTTGAGDVFAGVLAARLARTHDLSRAVEVAQRAASWSVSRPGIAPPRLADLDSDDG